MSQENQERLVEILNRVSHRFNPELGVTAEYIALILDINGVWAPPQPAKLTCPNCGKVTHSPHDIAEGYCRNCHDWTSPGSERHGR